MTSLSFTVTGVEKLKERLRDLHKCQTVKEIYALGEAVFPKRHSTG